MSRTTDAYIEQMERESHLYTRAEYGGPPDEYKVHTFFMIDGVLKHACADRVSQIPKVIHNMLLRTGNPKFHFDDVLIFEQGMPYYNHNEYNLYVKFEGSDERFVIVVQVFELPGEESVPQVGHEQEIDELPFL